MKKPFNDKKKVIFRRYRTLPDGTILDAWKYGIKAWPIEVDRVE